MKDFKDKRGVSRTESLFHETIQPSIRKRYDPVYSLRDYDYKGYPSAYNIYMSAVDETDAALQLVGSMAHWRKLCALRWFMEGRPECQFEGIAQWRQDMKDRDASLARKVLLENTKEGNITAARAVLAESKGVVKKVYSKNNKISPDDSNVTNFLDNYKKGK